MTIGARNQQISAGILRAIQNRLRGGSSANGHKMTLCVKAVPAEVAKDILIGCDALVPLCLAFLGTDKFDLFRLLK